MNEVCCIRVLPELVVKKIAAGEVVERPASVVKELLENALDAGATRVVVTIEDGGKQLIRVTDDGCGMSAEELRLAITPHATSKLSDEEDLFSIRTMGFRGEALASVSSIAKLRIVSRKPDSLEGREIQVVADEVKFASAAGCPPGTTVEVRDLFFNVPARRKFLRASSTETGQINEQLARIALAHPHIAFELTNNGRVTQRLPACANCVERIAKFYGPQLAEALLRVERDERGIRLEAYVAPPAQSRATAQWQYTFVNGRYIRDRQIQHAIKEAHRGLMEPHRHGVVFLFLTVDPAFVDVNVHPTKTEVRWADGRLIYSQVLSALRETFQNANLMPTLQTDRAPVDEAQQDQIRREFAAHLKAIPPIVPSTVDSRGGFPESEAKAYERTGVAPQGSGAGGMDTWRALYQPPSGSSRAEGTLNQIVAPFQGGGMDEGSRPPRAIQMHNLYLVVETDEGIVIVDQHALHERVLYEQLVERMTSGKLESQRLLLPEMISVTAEQLALLEEYAELLDRVGIEVTPIGDDSVAVHTFPSLLKNPDIAAFMQDLFDRLAQRPSAGQPEVLLNDVLSMMACKAAIKAGDPMTNEEIEALFAQRRLIQNSSSCPHGRPTMLQLTKADLERQFHRR